MPAEAPSSLYEQLAEKYNSKGKFPERDRFLILAADAAWNAGQPGVAEDFRRRILDYNPNHLLRPYGSYADALKSADILAYVQQLRRGYPRDRALELLKELDQEPRNRPRTEEEVDVKVEPAKGPGVFKLASDAKPKTDPPKPTSRSGMPPMLTQSQSLHSDNAAPQRQAAPQPAWQPPRQTTAASIEPTPGSWIGSFLFLVVALAGLAALGFVFVWPLMKQ